jgi:transposase
MTAQPIAAQPMTAQPTTPAHFIGVDVAKDEVVIAHAGQLQTVSNSKRDLASWLKTLPPHTAVGLEATNCYHQLLADLATAAGHTVYVLNPKALKHYRTATSGRAKTDSCDAQLIVRYLEREHAHLHPYVPLSKTLRTLNMLLHRRATVVKTQTQLRLSLQQDAKTLGLSSQLRAVLQSQKSLLKAIDAKIEALLQQDEVQAQAQRLDGILGMGPLTAAALLVALERGTFATPDALVAFIGLDPTPRDSGTSRGRRKLSKQGDGETRRLLFNAARSASKTKVWQPFYRRYRDRGLSARQACCILARKLVRTAWSLYTHGTTFCPERLFSQNSS